MQVLKNLLLVLLIISLCSCSKKPASYLEIASRPFTPVCATLDESMRVEVGEENSWKYYYKQAAESKTLGEARKSYEKLFQVFNDEAEGECGYKIYRIAAAEFEMVRIYYLLGMVQKGDEFLAESHGKWALEKLKEPTVKLPLSSSDPYIPIWKELDRLELKEVTDKDWKEEHLVALGSITLGEAHKRYEKLIGNLTRVDRGDPSDYQIWNYETIAAWELIRTKYLLGKEEEADKLLSRLYDKNYQFGEWN